MRFLTISLLTIFYSITSFGDSKLCLSALKNTLSSNVIGSRPAGAESLEIRMLYKRINLKSVRKFPHLQSRNYLLVMWEAAEKLANKLSKGKIKTVKNSISSLAKTRRYVAEVNGVPDANKFGEKRIHFAATELSYQYKKYSKVAEKYITNQTPIIDKPLKFGSSNSELYEAFSTDYTTYITKEKLYPNQKSIELTRIRVVGKGKNKKIYLVHTDPKNSKLIIKKCNELLSTILKAGDINKKELINSVAEIHWWLAHAMPLKRGSAGAIDALTKSIFMAKGYKTSVWKNKISPDLEAMTSTLKEFKANYINLFE